MNLANLSLLMLATIVLSVCCTNNSTQHTQGSHVAEDAVNDAGLYKITCDSVGVISKNDKELQLRMKFGETEVTRDSFFLEGMFQEMITVVNKGKANELKIYWNEHGQIRTVEIENQLSPYYLAKGIKIGATLANLEQINEKPISFYGFGWDYGGTVSTFNQGKLEQEYPCFSGILKLDNENASTDPNLFGDKLFTTDIPGIDKHNICLRTIRISYR